MDCCHAQKLFGGSLDSARSLFVRFALASYILCMISSINSFVSDPTEDSLETSAGGAEVAGPSEKSPCHRRRHAEAPENPENLAKSCTAPETGRDACTALPETEARRSRHARGLRSSQSATDQIFEEVAQHQQALHLNAIMEMEAERALLKEKLEFEIELRRQKYEAEIREIREEHDAEMRILAEKHEFLELQRNYYCSVDKRRADRASDDDQ